MAEQESVPNNVYTVLVLVALVALLGGLIFVVMRSMELFGSWNPADAKDLAAIPFNLPMIM